MTDDAIKKTLEELEQLLIRNCYPFSKINSGELESSLGVHLEQIERGPHEEITHKPSDIHDGQWIKKTVLSWGPNTGWDIKSDGSIALCRVDYDDYINFKIKYLTEEEKLEYNNE
jgi:hypothetical protein